MVTNCLRVECGLDLDGVTIYQKVVARLVGQRRQPRVCLGSEDIARRLVGEVTLHTPEESRYLVRRLYQPLANNHLQAVKMDRSVA